MEPASQPLRVTIYHRSIFGKQAKYLAEHLLFFHSDCKDSLPSHAVVRLRLSPKPACMHHAIYKLYWYLFHDDFSRTVCFKWVVEVNKL